MGADALTSGLEGAWTQAPTQWDNGFLENLFGYEWEQTTSPAGATQWTPTRYRRPGVWCPMPTSRDQRHAPMMLTSDLALKVDPIYAVIAKRFHEQPRAARRGVRQGLVQAVHRDMGPVSRATSARGCRSRSCGRIPSLPSTTTWSPTPTSQPSRSSSSDSGLSINAAGLHRLGGSRELPRHRQAGGANGARIRLAPQKDWEVNDPEELAGVLATLEQIQADFNAAQTGRTRISLADLIVLGGSAAVEQAAQNAGHEITVPFAPGRTDATAEQTDVSTFVVLEPAADGFRITFAPAQKLSPETLLVDRAYMLTLSGPEMTVLVGGLRVLNANTGRSPARGAHRAAGNVHKRLLRQSARHVHGVDDVGRGGERVRGAGPRHR